MGVDSRNFVYIDHQRMVLFTLERYPYPSPSGALVKWRSRCAELSSTFRNEYEGLGTCTHEWGVGTERELLLYGYIYIHTREKVPRGARQAMHARAGRER